MLTLQDSRRNITIKNHGSKKGCYVTTFQAPLGIYRGYHRGIYLDPSAEVRADALDIIRAQGIRWGAYGDPAALPLDVIKAWTPEGARWTGYSHQWRTAPEGFSDYLMASADSLDDAIEAHSRGWRTFRVDDEANPLDGEISCPASDEAGKLTDCRTCGLCNGSSGSSGRINRQVTPTKWKRPQNGVVLYEGPSAIDGSPIVAIVTGFKDPSKNDKTGTMLQVWILRADVEPHEAQKTGADSAVCGDCPMRPLLIKQLTN